ncbi:ABC transporter permease [Cytobacillus purgationiresistens]|uniref:NitT/TauT family transport system permease protein n=1 Tax=Cytobacillus purgationiresistens TaxID=863449 RepID=A0ABU0AQK6_9BACI|nr:ABC transporter permease [Cytobacillus purgationiresistens]MDQ0273553.1 NitT/TauT family transport system permease protein [Cytobacillus purgationiresistens]
MKKEDAISIGKINHKPRKISKNQRNFIISTVSVITFLVIWELVSYYKVINPLFISSPLSIVEAAATLFVDPAYWNHIGVSAYEFTFGFLLALMIGIPIGIFAGWNQIFNAVINPFVSALYVTPKVALLPIIIIAFGIGITSKIVVVFLMAFFPIVMSAQKAMSTLDQNLIKAARSFTATEFQIFRTIALPSTVPFLLNGIRLGLGQGLIAIVVGEMYASTAGIGYHLTHAGQNLKTAEMFVGVAVIAISGVLLTGIIGLIEKRFSSWKPE